MCVSDNEGRLPREGHTASMSLIFGCFAAIVKELEYRVLDIYRYTN